MPDPALLAKLLQDVEARARPMGLALCLDCATILELVPRFGFRWILINQEHTLIQGTRYLTELIRVADATGLPHLVRVNALDGTLVRDALDAGSYGVMLPGVETAAQVEELFKYVRFPPHGQRTFCSIQRTAGYSVGRYTEVGHDDRSAIQFGNEHALVIPTLATSSAVENLDELMAIPDCPIWHLSFSDLALSFGINPAENPGKAVRLFVEISKHVHAAGKHVTGMMVPIAGQTADLAEGMSILGNDLPYALDTACLGFGMAEMRNIADAHRARGGGDKPE